MQENLENKAGEQAVQAAAVEPTAEELSEILQIRRDKLAALQKAGQDPFEQTKYDRTAYAADINNKFEEYEGQAVSVAGRVMSKRDMGKASFFDLSDATGKIQVYMKMNLVGEEVYAQFKKWDIGDIVGVKGEVFRTRHGEISIRGLEVVLLSKSLLPLA